MPALARRGYPLPTTQSSTSPCTGEDNNWVELVQLHALERNWARCAGEEDIGVAKGVS